MASPSWLGGEINAIIQRASETLPFNPPTTKDILATIQRKRNIEFGGMEMVIAFYREDAVKRVQMRKGITKKACDKVRKQVFSMQKKVPSSKIAR